MTYTIKSVSPETRQYDTRYGAMTSYKVLFNESPNAVEISQKSTTPPPTVGQALEGTIDMSGQYGPKFKKEYNPGGGGNFTGNAQSGNQSPSTAKPSSTQSSGSKDFSNFTMFLSYAKDLQVARITSGMVDAAPLETFAEEVLKAGYKLYDGRPDAPAKESETTSVLDKVFQPTDDQQVTFDEGELPWPANQQ